MKLVTFILICFMASQGISAENSQSNYNKLQNQVKSLENLKIEKIDAIENSEAKRWNLRYEQNARTKQYEEHLRALESSYSRLASDMNNKQEDLLRYANETRELKFSLEEMKSLQESFISVVLQDVEKSSENLSRDIPLLLNERILMLSELSKKGEGKNPGANSLLQGYFDYKGLRLDLTTSQSITQQMSLIGEVEHRVTRLQLGTVFLGESSRDQEGVSQILLRTGRLQGKVFAWRHKLVQGFNKELISLIKQAESGHSNVNVVLDITQSKSFGTGFTTDSKSAAAGTLTSWFKSGGLVMYPLMAVALLGLLLVIERFLVLTSRSTNSLKLMERIEPMLKIKDWLRAQKECESSKTALHKVLTSILKKAGESRQAAEKAMQERVLREIPDLEKRMTIIAAIGGAAPLLGLLGTVSGMISLFKIITDVGTNDPRILAGGISEALVTTQTGLIIAIPLLLMHGFLSDRLDKIENDISAQSLTLLNKIWPQA